MKAISGALALVLGMEFTLLPAAVWAESRSFRDWTAECDDQLSCRAWANDRSRKVEMRLLRHHHEGSSWQLLFRFKDVAPPSSGDVNFAVDGGDAVEFSGSLDFPKFSDGVTVGVAGKDELGLLFTQIKAGKDLRLAYDSSPTRDKTEEREMRFSLSGLAAALLWIDERQNRVGSSNDVSFPSGVDDTTDVVVSDKAKAELERRAAAICPAEEPRKITSYRLPSKDVLHVVECDVDLKNTQAGFFRESSVGISLLLFADYFDGWKGADRLTNATFDPKTGHLQSSSTSWGLAWVGCQYEGSWVWSDDDFKLLEFAYVSDCENGKPEDSKILYKRQVN